MGTLRFICNQMQIKMQSNLECYNLLEPLTVRYNDIVSEYSATAHLTEKRFKRGAWISGIGSLSKTIFGTLDENDGIRYNEAIQNMQNNEKRLATLMKENILITSTTLSKFNETIYKIKINEANLNQAIDNFSAQLKNISAISHELSIKSDINSIGNSLEASLLALSFRLEDLTNAIMFCSQNILHPAVLSPEQLYQEIVNNFRHIPANLRLPTHLTLSNMYSLMNSSSLICYSSSNKVNFILRLPLVSPTEYNLYHVIALPTPHNSIKPNSFSYIIPSNKYIAMTMDKTEYCNLDSPKECIVINSHEYICDITTVFPTSANPSCESELLSNIVNTLPVQCKTDFIHGQLDLWKSLKNNAWIFVQSKTNKIYVECRDQKIIDLNIIGTGILRIPENCIAFCKGTKLIPKSTPVKINVSVSHSDFNIINDSCCNLDKFTNVMSNEPPLKLQNVDLDFFTAETRSKLNSMSVKADEILADHPIIKYETPYSIVISLISIIVFLFCIIKCVSIIKSHNRLIHRFPTFHRPTSNPPTTNQTETTESVTPLKIRTHNPQPENTPAPTIRTNV